MSSPRSSCEVCRATFTIEDAPMFAELCEEHQRDVTMEHARQYLRNIIPPGLHHAKPSDLPSALQSWSSLGGTGLYLYGPVGTGKSHAAAALLKRGFMELHTAGHPVGASWMNVPITIMSTITAISRRAANAGEAWDQAQRAAITVLDDIGIEQPKDWVRARLYALIEHRLQHQMPTLVTSNLNLAELADRLDSPQIASRLSQMTAQISFEGSSDRRPDLGPSL